MRRSLSLLIVCLVTLAAGCGNEESAPKGDGSAKKPENMCEAVAPALPENWGLNKTSADKSKEKTDCTLADESGRTTMVVSVLKPKSGGVDAALKDLCSTYIGVPLEGDDEECTKAGPVKLAGAPAELQRGVRLEEPEAVLWVSFRTNNRDIAAHAEDVLEDVENAVSQK